MTRSTKRTAAKRATRVSESSVESEIRTLLELHGWRTHKIDVMRGVTVEYATGGKSRGKRRFSEGAAGQPDLIAVRGEGACPQCDGSGEVGNFGCPMCMVIRDGFPESKGWRQPAILYIETKAPDGKVGPHQAAFHAVLRKEGYPVIVARSWADVVAGAIAAGIEIEASCHGYNHPPFPSSKHGTEEHHGLKCPKAEHVGSGYLHDADDDGPYDVDGVMYCGRCHRCL